MNPHIQKIQLGLGLLADGKRGPVTTAAILQAADAGRLSVIAPSPPPIINIPQSDDIPPSGDARLVGVHAVLADLVREVSGKCDVPFTVIEGLRSAERQRELVAKGASKTMNSRHLTGHAVDLWPLDATGRPLPAGSKDAEARLWSDLGIIAAAMKAEAKARGVMIEWGGDWGWDAPHFQLNRSAYPA